jgi:hypothetical protein
MLRVDGVDEGNTKVEKDKNRTGKLTRELGT